MEKRDSVEAVEIMFLFDSEELGSETVWAFALGHGTYRLANQPLCAEGVEYGDIVRAERIDGYAYPVITQRLGAAPGNLPAVP